MDKTTKQIVGGLEPYFAKAPQLPANWKDVLANLSPWLALIFGVLGVLGGLAALGIVGVLSPAMMMGAGVPSTGLTMVAVVLGLVSSVLLLVAFPGLKNRKASGWNWLFWSELVSLLSSVVMISLFGILMGVVGLYLVFQIKSHFK